MWGSQSTEALFGQGSQAVVDNGRFVVSCYGPQDIGAAGLDALVAKVRAQFKPGTQLAGSNVKVLVSAANRGPGLQTGQNEPPFYQVPVTVAFTAWYAA